MNEISNEWKFRSITEYRVAMANKVERGDGAAQVPANGATVLAGRHELERAAAAHAHALHAGRVPPQLARARVGTRVPQPHHAVVAAARQQVRIAADERARVRDALMRLGVSPHRIASRRIPNLYRFVEPFF